MKKFITSILILMVLMSSGLSANVYSYPIKWLTEAETAYGHVQSYTAIFHKQQRIAGELLKQENIYLKPNDPELMSDNLRPFTSTGLGFLLKTVALNMRKAIKAEVLTFTDKGIENIYGRDTKVIQLDIQGEKTEDYDGARFIINQDVKSKILIKLRVYNRNGLLIENYGYENLNTDARLSDTDFDQNNPNFNF